MMTRKYKCWWKIDVASWGIHEMLATEEEAEEWRAHKARWEQSVARKERNCSECPKKRCWRRAR